MIYIVLLIKIVTMVGAAPSFSKVHLLRALLIIKKIEMGRKNLVKKLGVGEGSVRTILGKLKQDKLIISAKEGHKLTKKGQVYLKKYLKRFTLPQKFYSDEISQDSAQSLIVVHNVASKIKSGIREHDLAVKAGADGSLVLIYKNNNLKFPGNDHSLDNYPNLKNKVSDLKLMEDDAIIIVFGKTETDAENGALAIALDLTGN